MIGQDGADQTAVVPSRDDDSPNRRRAPTGTLYVVATPIGNLEDITLRALRILRDSNLIAAEDTRVTRKLLSHFDIHTPLTSYHQHTRGEKAESLISRLKSGESIALVTDAGTPGISDPGPDLVTHALAEQIEVVPIPGPCAAIAGLVASGLSTGRFAFEGFPPRTRSDRASFFDSLSSEPRTMILYEAPGRVIQTLEALHAALGDRPVAVMRELTKLFEESYRGTLAGALQALSSKRPRGEYTIVISGASSAARSSVPDGESGTNAVKSSLQSVIDSGASRRDAVMAVSKELGLPRRYVYSLVLEIFGK